MNRKLKLIALLLLLLQISTPHLYAQTNVEVYGQNRVQYRRFEWKYYDADHFKIYHYDRGGRELARYVAEQAEQDVAAIEKRMGGVFPDKLNIILYNSYSDYLQSNIGLNSELQIQSDNPAGKVTIVGDKLVIYFTGKHADLKSQLRDGMSRVVMEHLMFGDNITEMVKIAVLLDLDPWVTEGYVKYVVDGWTGKDDNEWKNLLLSKPKTYFHEIATKEPSLAGKAFWKYIAVRHGENNVKNLLYLTQVKSSLDKALMLTIGQDLKQTSDSVIKYYQDRYVFEEQIFQPVDTSVKLSSLQVVDDESVIKNIVVSPRGGDVAYVKWHFGEYQVILEKTHLVDGVAKRESSVLLSGGIKNYREIPDPDYPLLSWNNTGFKLGIIFQNKNNLRIRVYNSIKGKIQDFKIRPSRFERITGFTFMEDDDMIVLSAIKNGQSDLFDYRLKGGRTTQITDDAWDDFAPVFVTGGARKGILFLSNRPQPFLNIQPLPNELPAGPMNAFFYSTTTKSYDLLQLTDNKKGNITQAIPYGPDHFAYLSNAWGVTNRYVVMFGRNSKNQDSAYSVPMTNFGRDILYHQYNPASAKIADVIRIQDKYEVLFHKLDLPAPDGDAVPAKISPISFIDGVVPRKNQTGFANPLRLSSPKSEKEEEDVFQIKEGNALQSGFYSRVHSDAADSAAVEPGPESERLAEMLSIKSPADTSILEGKKEVAGADMQSSDDKPLDTSNVLDGKRILYVDSTFVGMRSKKYYLSLKPDFFGIRGDNSVIFTRYQSYDNNGGSYSNPAIAGMLTGSITDKMEDYRFTAALRIPLNFSGYTTFFQFQNFKRRVDWALIFLRQEIKYTYPFIINNSLYVEEPGKTVTNLLQARASYPLDRVRSFRMDFGLRQDRILIKGADLYGLILPNTSQYWALSRAEYVYDNTRNPAMNIWNGLRYKLFAEYMYRMYSKNPYETEADSTGAKGLYNFGIDLRFYQKIHKNFIAAVRFAGAHSGGNQKIMYFLGGVDNSISPNTGGLPPSGANDYAFQTIATNLRGYPQNARNGNTYAVMNAELRFPIVTTLSHHAVKSTLLKNFQIIAFTDIGSAWEGFLPNAAAFDRFYHVYYQPDPNQPPVLQVNIPNFADNGIAMGYGLGVRTLLFGYFARVDYARNIIGKDQWHFSVGTDF